MSAMRKSDKHHVDTGFVCQCGNYDGWTYDPNFSTWTCDVCGTAFNHDGELSEEVFYAIPVFGRA
jgi:hypothetical protein